MDTAILFTSGDDFDRALAIVRTLAEDAPHAAQPVRAEGQSSFILTTKSYEKRTKHLGGIPIRDTGSCPFLGIAGRW